MYPSLSPEIWRARRSALLDRMPDRSAAIYLSAPQAPRNGDVIFPYRQDSDLWYLTGFAEPSAVLLLTRGLDSPESVLFLRDRDPKQEVWTGARIGVTEAPSRLGVDEACGIDHLTAELTRLLRPADILIYHERHPTPEAAAVTRALAAARVGPRGPHKGPHTVIDPALSLHELRLRKEPEEIERIRVGNDITGEALREVMAGTAPGTGEWEIQADLEASFRRRGGWGWSYPTIVAAGANACVLHYEENAATCGAGELVLIDAGAELDGYSADISRTFPVDPRFSGPQRDLYQVVLDAQNAVIDAVKPGRTLDELHATASEVLAEGAVHLGLLEGPADKVLSDQSIKRYYPHQTSHWLGLDVHDVGRYYLAGKPRVLEPGMVFTVEPGLYVPNADEDAPAAFRGLGVRIEDDVLVTADGRENLSAGIPKSIQDIEGLK